LLALPVLPRFEVVAHVAALSAGSNAKLKLLVTYFAALLGAGLEARTYQNMQES